MEQEANIAGHRVVFRAWNYGQKQDAVRRATSWRRDADGSLSPDVDPWIINDLMLLTTLVEWDLRSLDGSALPITMESLHAIEPPELVEEMISFAQRLNGVTQEERKKS